MSLEEIQNKAIKTYNNNLLYLKEIHPRVFEKVDLFSKALEENLISPIYDLRFEDPYFDMVNVKTNEMFYNQNSYKISKELVEEQITYDAKKQSFKTFYEDRYPNEFASKALISNVLLDSRDGNAPFVNLIQKNKPKDEEYINIPKYIIFGIGLGIHLPLIHQKIKSNIYLIIEPNLEIFRLSLFVTDYTKIALDSKIIFSIADETSIFRELFQKFLNEAYIFNHYLKFFKLTEGFNSYIEDIQNTLISQDHLCYSYHRIFQTIYRTNKYIKEDFKILNLHELVHTKFPDKPILVLAAGPSLQKNIDFVKLNQGKFIIIAIYATMPLLEKNNIKPDIITQYDSQNRAVLNTIEKVEDISFFDNSLFIFASHVDQRLTKYLQKDHIFMFQALYELKIGFASLTSPSIGELTYALSLFMAGDNNIYLLGLDLAFSSIKETHIDGHSGSNAFNELKDEKDSKIENYDLRTNTIVIKGNFKEEIYSTPLFLSSINVLNQHTIAYKKENTTIYNLSDGAYFKNTNKMKISDIDTKLFNSIEKENLYINLYKNINSCSKIGYNSQDIEHRKNIQKEINRIEKELNKFINKRKYANKDEYMNALFILFDKILLDLKDQGLQSLLQNFASANLHYIFYLLNLKNVRYFKEYQDELNTIIYKQFNKILDTYSISLKL